MKKFTSNQEETKKSGRNRRRLFAGKSLRKHEVIAGVAITVFAFLHFVSPFILTEQKIVSSQPQQIVPENKESSRVEPKIEAKSVDVLTPPAVPASGIVKTGAKSAPSSAVPKKRQQASRESRAERLRRAERILTGA